MPISMLINSFIFIWKLLIYCLCLNYHHHHVYERKIKWNHDPRCTLTLLAIRKAFYTCLLVVFLSIINKYKNTKNIFTCYLLLIKLIFVCYVCRECLTNTQMSWGCLLLPVTRKGQGIGPPFPPRVKHSSHRCGEKLHLLHHSTLGIPTSGNLKSIINAIKGVTYLTFFDGLLLMVLFKLRTSNERWDNAN
jgi:hypothetical protein